MTKKTVVMCGLVLIGGLSCGTIETLILKPTAQIRRLPTDFGYTYETKTVPTPAGNTISLWHIPAKTQRKGIIVTVPGNDANKSRYILSLPIFADNGWDIILLDYTGFGESPGKASLTGLFDSTFGAIDYAKTQSDVVVGYGVSIGTGVLARVAAEREITACVFESTMILRQAASLFLDHHGLVGSPIGGIADLVVTLDTPDDFDTKKWIQQVRCPKLFIHSPDDTVTPFAGAMEVFKLSPHPKHMFVSQGEHALQVVMEPDLYRNVVNGWLDGIINDDPIEDQRFLQYFEEEVFEAFTAMGLTPPAPGTFGR